MMNGIQRICCATTLIVAAHCITSPLACTAQTSPSEIAERTLAEPPVVGSVGAEQAASATASLPWLELMFRGGWLMLPILLTSVIVVAIAIERAIALRRSRILPVALAGPLSQMAERGNFDPRGAGALCEQYPSALARVVQAMLARLGRSATEIEQGVRDACQREADRMYSNVRTLNLAATVAPLLGLLGTVQGMIQAFFVTANLTVGANKGEALAEGIYIALVTTFAGLSVAIPASVLAHMFESRILKLLRDIEQFASDLLPQAERYDFAADHRTAPPRPMPKSKAS